jgi:hypothetical protein
VLAATSVNLPERTLELNFVPDSLDFMIITMCPAGLASFEFTINGKGNHLGVACNNKWSHGTAAEQEQFLANYGVRAGSPVTLAFTAYVGEETSGKLSVGVAEPVPVNDLPQLSRPTTLPPLRGGDGNVATVRSDPANPLKPRTIKIGGHQHYDFFVQLQTPGRVSVAFNGNVFMTCEKFDYAPTNADPAPKDFDYGCGEERVNDGIPRPDPATVTVTPESVTGAWQVRIDDEPRTTG